MNVKTYREVTVASILLVFGRATLAHAGECVNDWPTPSFCFPDILCAEYAEFWDWRRSVVHLYGPDIGGTGVLINSGDCDLHGTNCGAPYLLTANHVVSGQLGHSMTAGEMNDIQTLTGFTFGLEAATCGGLTAGNVISFDGAQIVAHSAEADLLLLKLSTSLPPELSDGQFDQAISISHPCGAPKRIAISDLGEIVKTQVMGREVYDVYWWEDGALASASSGAPLLTRSSGGLRGIFTNTMQAGSEACSDPNGIPAQDRFTAISTIISFLPAAVRGGTDCIGHFDANEGAPILGTVEDSSYYVSLPNIFRRARP
jgi:hypothetical protein